MANGVHIFRYKILKRISDGIVWLDEHISNKMLKVCSIIVASAALIALGINVYKQVTMKPYEYVENSLKDINLSPDSLLCETTDGEYTLVFYYNQSRNVCCAVLKDRVLGYETVRTSGVIDPSKASRLSDSEYSSTDSYLGSNLNTAANRQENAWIYWGVVFNDLYHGVSEEIYLDDMRCNVRAADNDLSIHVFWTIDKQRDGFCPEMRVLKIPD